MAASSGSVELSAREQAYLERQIRGATLYRRLAAIGVGAAAGLTAIFLWRGEFNMLRFVVIILILLQARANLKQHKDAKLLKKLRPADAQRPAPGPEDSS